MRLAKTNNIHPAFKLNGVHYNSTALKNTALVMATTGASYEQEIGNFLNVWLSDSETLEVQTSGTTGPPKKMLVRKAALLQSAIATGVFFNLSPGQKALHCLPSKFIAGKMMLVRALVLGLELDCVPPGRNPLEYIKSRYDFAAMTPYQALHSIDALHQIRILIVGGAPVTQPLQKSMLQVGVTAYETYGMTETLSHIAVRSMDAPPGEFEVLPNITIDQNDFGCLVIDAPNRDVQQLSTQDQVKILDSKRFVLLGRTGNVVNSGGIKMHPERIEAKLAQAFDLPFFVGGIPDEFLGERLVLAFKSPAIESHHIKEQLKKVILDKYEIPKTVFLYDKFVETPTGKIKRKETLANPPLAILNL